MVHKKTAASKSQNVVRSVNEQVLCAFEEVGSRMIDDHENRGLEVAKCNPCHILTQSFKVVSNDE